MNIGKLLGQGLKLILKIARPAAEERIRDEIADALAKPRKDRQAEPKDTEE
jgi:hypothetical protein